MFAFFVTTVHYHLQKKKKDNHKINTVDSGQSKLGGLDEV